MAVERFEIKFKPTFVVGMMILLAVEVLCWYLLRTYIVAWVGAVMAEGMTL